MPRVPERLRRQVRERAQGRCEYCLIHEDDIMYPHEADHIVAEKHGGPTTLENLAWACGVCNRNKGSDLSSIDPTTGKGAFPFNPRTHQWKRHFRLNNGRIEGITAAGRATASLLQFNTAENIADRLRLIGMGRYPTR